MSAVAIDFLKAATSLRLAASKEALRTAAGDIPAEVEVVVVVLIVLLALEVLLEAFELLLLVAVFEQAVAASANVVVSAAMIKACCRFFICNSPVKESKLLKADGRALLRFSRTSRSRQMFFRLKLKSGAVYIIERARLQPGAFGKARAALV